MSVCTAAAVERVGLVRRRSLKAAAAVPGSILVHFVEYSHCLLLLVGSFFLSLLFFPRLSAAASAVSATRAGRDVSE